MKSIIINNPIKVAIFYTLVFILAIFLFSGCKSRKVAIDDSKSVDRSEINSQTEVTEVKSSEKTDKTVTLITTQTKTGEVVVEEFTFSPGTVDAKEQSLREGELWRLPVERITGYKRTTERALDKTEQSLERKDITQADSSKKDSSGSTNTKKDIKTKDKTKAVEAKADYWWILWLSLIVGVLVTITFILKNPFKR